MNPLALVTFALKFAELAQQALTQGGETLQAYGDLRKKLQSFQQSSRDPTQAEFNELMAETDTLTDRLNRAAARLG